MDPFEQQWIVLRWPVGLLTEAERDCLEEYLDVNFQLDPVRFEAGPEASGVDVLGSAQGVVREAVLEYIREFLENPTTDPPTTIFDDDDDDD